MEGALQYTEPQFGVGRRLDATSEHPQPVGEKRWTHRLETTGIRRAQARHEELRRDGKDSRWLDHLYRTIQEGL